MSADFCGMQANALATIVVVAGRGMTVCQVTLRKRRLDTDSCQCTAWALRTRCQEPAVQHDACLGRVMSAPHLPHAMWHSRVKHSQLVEARRDGGYQAATLDDFICFELAPKIERTVFEEHGFAAGERARAPVSK
jgi:hypothetical protein